MLGVKEDRQAFEIQVSAAEPVVRELLQRDEWLSDLEVTNAGLEEAFLSLTQNHIAIRNGATEMATTTIPATSPFRAARSASGRLVRPGGEVRNPEVRAAPDLLGIDAVCFPVMFYVLFGIVLVPAGAQPHADRHLPAGDHGVLRRDGRRHVQLRRRHRHGARPGMAAGEARLAHAAAGVFPREDRERDGVCHCHFAGAARGRRRLRRSALGDRFAAAKLVAILVLGSIPFSAMGLALGYFAKPNSAPAMVNLVYLPMSFCSGLWIPIFVLPQVLQNVAQVLPPYHVSQLALNAIGMGPHPTPAWGHWRR